MTTLRLGWLCACFASVALVACGSDDGARKSGLATSPDEALNATDCYLGFTPPATSYSGYACSGTTKSSSVSGIGPNSWDDVRMTIELSLNTAPAIGALDVASLTVRIPGTNGNDLLWSAQPGSCAATAVKSATDTDFNWVYYRIDIACVEPATPAADNPGQPMELGQFSIVTFFAP